jgi:thiamine-monophosphate kinase
LQSLLQQKNKYIHGLIDTSDGLINDSLRLCQEKFGFHVFIENLPIHQDTNKLAFQLGTTPEDYALWGGEDFELLMTVHPDHYEEFSDWHLVGQVTTEPGVFLNDSIRKTEITEFRGWQHFNDFSK